MTVLAFVQEFLDNSVVAAVSRWAGEGAVVGGSSFLDAVVLSVDGPLYCDSEWGDACSWDELYDVWLNG